MILSNNIKYSQYSEKENANTRLITTYYFLVKKKKKKGEKNL